MDRASHLQNSGKKECRLRVALSSFKTVSMRNIPMSFFKANDEKIVNAIKDVLLFQNMGV